MERQFIQRTGYFNWLGMTIRRQAVQVNSVRPCEVSKPRGCGVGEGALAWHKPSAAYPVD